MSDKSDIILDNKYIYCFEKEKNMEKIKNKFLEGSFNKYAIIVIMALYDVLTINLSYILALLFRFDFEYTNIPKIYLDSYIKFAPYLTVFALIIFYNLRLYSMVLKFVGVLDFIRTGMASIIIGIFQFVFITIFIQRMPISYHLFGFMIQTFFILLSRFFYRFFIFEKNRRNVLLHDQFSKKAMIIGAGSAGQLVLNDIIKGNGLNLKVVCFIDDDKNKWKGQISGIPVVGGRDDIMDAVEKYEIEQIIIAIPSADKKDSREIVNLCRATNCEVKILPGLYQLINGEIQVGSITDVKTEDLLGREPITMLDESDFKYIENRVILVTGGGGTIGSELCRQIVSHNPKQLVIFDIYENSAYEIQQELIRKYPNLNLVVLIGSIRDKSKVDNIFSTYKPDIVYHAAAHKHVPLMETSPSEAIKNNVLGTYNLVHAALFNYTHRFILISTDKAVNPTNIMGASKRVCEMIIQSMDRVSKSNESSTLPNINKYTKSKFTYENTTDVGKKPRDRAFCTEFVAVRFGNVLGSNGSVIPLFKQQIAEGGPVTVTHPDIIRYFMTISEAVSLVLQAGNFAKGGEIFVLDMGEPVKIDSLARNLIKLSGLDPDKDIEIVYSGLRPGEKLYEEKLMAEEGMISTPNKLIHIGQPLKFDENKFFKDMEMLAKCSSLNDEKIIEVVSSVVTTFHSPEEDLKKNKKVYEKLYKQATK